MKNRCFRVLRKVSPAHGVLPKSYFLPGVALISVLPYACGGSTDVWKGQLDGNQVCVKALRTQDAANLDKIKRVRGGSTIPPRGCAQSNSDQRFYREIVGWKYVSHANVVPFLGISETLFSFCIISPWLSGGNIFEYIRKHRGANRFQLVSNRYYDLHRRTV